VILIAILKIIYCKDKEIERKFFWKDVSAEEEKPFLSPPKE
jgi:hypothetical protein